MLDRVRIGASAVAVAALIAACTPAAVPTGAPTDVSSPTSSIVAEVTPAPLITVPPLPASTPVPGEPAEDSLPPSASVERDGVRLTIGLASNPMWASGTHPLTTTVENTGDTRLGWTVDGCGDDAWTLAEVDAAWRASDAVIPEELVPYRDWFIEEAGLDRPIRLRFGTAAQIGQRGGGCADLGIGRSLEPGERSEQRSYWDGTAAPRLGPPPSGPVAITATFERWWRGDEEAGGGEPITVTLESWVVDGAAPADHSPLEALDAALLDERFASWLVTRPLKDGADAIVEFHDDAGLWTVGLLTFAEHPVDDVLTAAYVDPVSGEVVMVRETRVP